MRAWGRSHPDNQFKYNIPSDDLFSVEWDEIVPFGDKCASALALVFNNYRTKAYPFDWVGATPGVILELLKNNFEDFYPKNAKSYINKYKINFAHFRQNSHIVNHDSFKRRSKRLVDLFSSNKKILFLYTTESQIFSKDFRGKQDEEYDNLKRIVDYLQGKYPSLYFKILACNLNQDRQSTEDIVNINIKCDKELISDNCETEVPKVYLPHRIAISDIVSNLKIISFNPSMKATIGLITNMDYTNTIKAIKTRWEALASMLYSCNFNRLIIRGNTTDMAIFRQIFVSKEYDLPFNIKPKFIIDAGANVGYASLFFADKFPEAEIVAIEPETSNCEILKQNTAKYKQIKLIQAGLWHKKANLKIVDRNGGKCGFMTEEADFVGGYDVPAITIDEILKQSKYKEIDILKLDIEGTEREIFSQNYESWLDKVKIIIIELHDRLREGCSEAFYSATKQYGFQKMYQGENVILFKENTIKLPKITIGLILFGGEKYLKYSLPSLVNQNYPNIEYLFRDQSPSGEIYEYVKRELPDVFNKVTIEKGGNLMHSGGHNALIRKMTGEYYISCSYDMLYEPDFVTKMVQEMERSENKKFGSGTCRLMQWDFEEVEHGKIERSKTKYIDSVGIGINKRHQFADMMQNKNIYNFPYLNRKNMDVFGTTAALAIYRKTALDDIAYINDKGDKEYFDELIHHLNDVDLAYRLQWAGYSCLYIPRATVYHDRQADAKRLNELKKSPQHSEKLRWIKSDSLFGHLVVMRKNYSKDFSWKVKFKKTSTSLRRFWNILKSERYMLDQYKKFNKLEVEINKKRDSALRRKSAKDIEKYIKW